MDQGLLDMKYDDLEKEYITYQYQKAGLNVTQVVRNCSFGSRTPVNRMAFIE
jgi:hypothetical protein